MEQDSLLGFLRLMKLAGASRTREKGDQGCDFFFRWLDLFWVWERMLVEMGDWKSWMDAR